MRRNEHEQTIDQEETAGQDNEQEVVDSTVVRVLFKNEPPLPYAPGEKISDAYNPEVEV